MCSRLAMSVIQSTFHASPDNPYVSISQANAWKTLEYFRQHVSDTHARELLRRAVGMWSMWHLGFSGNRWFRVSLCLQFIVFYGIGLYPILSRVFHEVDFAMFSIQWMDIVASADSINWIKNKFIRNAYVAILQYWIALTSTAFKSKGSGHDFNIYRSEITTPPNVTEGVKQLELSN
jgi:hypothetical protein